jgi:myo-inositol-1(or 4)-monophosphatase
MLMIREAGGFLTDLDGGDDPVGKGSICAGNEHIHPALLAVLRDA